MTLPLITEPPPSIMEPASESVTDVLARVVRLLRDDARGRSGYTLEELEGLLHLPITSNSDLVRSLASNPRLAVNPVTGRVTYVSRCSAQDRGELLLHLKTQGRSVGEAGEPLPGFPITDIVDAYPSAGADIDELTFATFDLANAGRAGDAPRSAGGIIRVHK